MTLSVAARVSARSLSLCALAYLTAAGVQAYGLEYRGGELGGVRDFDTLHEEGRLTTEQYDLCRIAQKRGEQGLQACETLISDPTVPYEVLRWATFKSIDCAQYMSGGMASALERGENWLRSHPDDPWDHALRGALARRYAHSGLQGFDLSPIERLEAVERLFRPIVTANPTVPDVDDVYLLVNYARTVTQLGEKIVGEWFSGTASYQLDEPERYVLLLERARETLFYKERTQELLAQADEWLTRIVAEATAREEALTRPDGSSPDYVALEQAVRLKERATKMQAGLAKTLASAESAVEQQRAHVSRYERRVVSGSTDAAVDQAFDDLGESP